MSTESISLSIVILKLNAIIYLLKIIGVMKVNDNNLLKNTLRAIELSKSGDLKNAEHEFLNFNPITPANCIPKKISSPPNPPSRKVSYPSFNSLKNIIMKNDSLTSEQKNNLINQISELYD